MGQEIQGKKIPTCMEFMAKVNLHNQVATWQPGKKAQTIHMWQKIVNKLKINETASGKHKKYVEETVILN